MSKEEQFYTDRSNLVSHLTDYIRLCQELGRDPEEEIEEAVYEAKENIK